MFVLGQISVGDITPKSATLDVLAMLPQIFIFLIIAIAGYGATRIIIKRLDVKAEEEKEEHPTYYEHSRRVHRILSYFGYVFFLILAVRISGLFEDVTWLIGPLAIIVIFASKEYFKNVIEFLFLTFEGHMFKGDVIKVQGKKDTFGKITERKVRAQVLTAFDGIDNIITNDEVFDNPVYLYSKALFRRGTVDVAFYMHDDQNVIEEEIKKVIAERDDILEEYPTDVLLEKFDKGLCYYKVHFWVIATEASIIKIQFEVKKSIAERMRELKVQAPFKQEDLTFIPV